jgi:paired amphipathic helix protein Sin3a
VSDVRKEGKPPEFDHAIQYVTKIKKRFVKDQPDVYKQFLEILHAYQKSSSSSQDQSQVIHAVLASVAALFQDHPDLLSDFRFFLPDTVQDMAQERLQQIVAQQQYSRMMGTDPSMAMMDPDRMTAAAHHAQYGMTTEQQGYAASRAHMDERLYQSHMHRTSIGMGPGRSERGMAVAAASRAAAARVHPQLSAAERSFFLRVKTALGARTQWLELLKVLDLNARGILSRSELLSLTEDLLHPQLQVELKALVLTKAAAEISAADTYHTLPVADLDFQGCRQCTPSYRSLPDGYPQLACSERAPWEQSVLNDRWVSIQTGSEDYSFKHMRRNAYEEALFRCEDERYEVDMVIDTNASTIRVLEPLAQEMATLRASRGFQWQFRLDRRALGVVHLKAIARVYGVRGEEMLELLRKNPGGAIPVILKRLKTKDTEWKIARAERNKTWRRVMADNFHRSLDHRSFYFRQHDKRAIAAKALLQEMQSRVEAAEKEVQEWSTRRSEPAASAAPGVSAAADAKPAS